nr:MAG TPA: hypothetical protein [Bacteriophage sp.]
MREQGHQTEKVLLFYGGGKQMFVFHKNLLFFIFVCRFCFLQNFGIVRNTSLIFRREFRPVGYHFHIPATEQINYFWNFKGSALVSAVFCAT